MATQNDNRFKDAWRALDEHSSTSGWNTIPVAAKTNLLLLAGRQHPQNLESLLIGFTVAHVPKQASLPQCKGFILDAVTISLAENRYYCLAVSRKQSANLELFGEMIEDILAVLERSNRTESEHFRVVIDRISAWQRFMSREDDGILGAEAELGLLGELQILLLLIEAGVPASDAIDWWQGPADSLHDFVCPRGDIEVKSSTRVGPFSARVATVDQLDESLVQPLFLAAVQFGLSASGFRLPDHIDSVRRLLGEDEPTLLAFEGKLFYAGYHQALASRYHRQFSYLLALFYEVTGTFPRLTKGTVPAGVVDTQYRIEIDPARYSSLPLNEILQQIG